MQLIHCFNILIVVCVTVDEIYTMSAYSYPKCYHSYHSPDYCLCDIDQ